MMADNRTRTWLLDELSCVRVSRRKARQFSFACLQVGLDLGLVPRARQTYLLQNAVVAFGPTARQDHCNRLTIVVEETLLFRMQRTTLS